MVSSSAEEICQVLARATNAGARGKGWVCCGGGNWQIISFRRDEDTRAVGSGHDIGRPPRMSMLLSAVDRWVSQYHVQPEGMQPGVNAAEKLAAPQPETLAAPNSDPFSGRSSGSTFSSWMKLDAALADVALHDGDMIVL